MEAASSDPDPGGPARPDFRDRHHNEARALGGQATHENLVLLRRRRHHEPFTELFGLFTFYQAFGALSHARKYRRWLTDERDLTPARLGTIIGRMRHSPPLQRLMNLEEDERTRVLLRSLFGPRNFEADGSPRLERMAQVMRRLHEHHAFWAALELDRQATARVERIIESQLRQGVSRWSWLGLPSRRTGEGLRFPA